MLIAELQNKTSVRRLGIIGSCRLHDPLKAAVRDRGGRFVWSAYNAFSHSPEEALQHLRICLGQIEMPDPFAPYMMKQDHAPLFPETLPDLVASCDTLVVEVSSFDLLRCGAYLFNQDYFAQSFVRGKGLPLLNWFRRVGVDRPPMEDALAAENALAEAGIRVTPSRQEILRGLRKHPSPDGGRAAMSAIARSAPRVIFCPILRVDGMPPKVAEERGLVAQRLHQGSKAANAEFLDPSDLLAPFKREDVLDGNGSDLFHYKPEFVSTIGRLLLDAVSEEP